MLVFFGFLVLGFLGLLIGYLVNCRCKMQMREEGKYITDFIAEKLGKGELRVPLEVLKR